MSLDNLTKVAEKDGYEVWDDEQTIFLHAVDGMDPAVTAYDILPGGVYFRGARWYAYSSDKNPDLEWGTSLVRRVLEKSEVQEEELVAAQ